MSRTKRQHLVSQTLLNRWAQDGKLVQVDLKTHKHALVPPNSVAFSRDFSTPLQVQNTEKVWGEIEGSAAAALNALDQGQPFNSTPIKDLIALHLIRSHEMMEECHKLLNRYQPIQRLTHLSFEDLQRHALERIGLHIVGPEAAYAEQTHINQMIYHRFREELSADLPSFLAQAQGLFRGAGLEVWTCESDRELVIGDTPAATVDETGTQFGLGSGVPIGSAAYAFMPLNPTTLAAVGPAYHAGTISTSQVETMNLIQCRRAQRFVYCRHGSGLHKWVLAELNRVLESVKRQDHST